MSNRLPAKPEYSKDEVSDGRQDIIKHSYTLFAAELTVPSSDGGRCQGSVIGDAAGK